jgi:hypothetical protein
MLISHLRTFGSFSVIQPACQQAREEKGSEGKVQYEKVVHDAKVFETEKLRCSRNSDGDVDTIAYAHHN